MRLARQERKVLADSQAWGARRDRGELAADLSRRIGLRIPRIELTRASPLEDQDARARPAESRRGLSRRRGRPAAKQRGKPEPGHRQGTRSEYAAAGQAKLAEVRTTSRPSSAFSWHFRRSDGRLESLGCLTFDQHGHSTLAKSAVGVQAARLREPGRVYRRCRL